MIKKKGSSALRESSLYPSLHPPGSEIILRIPGEELSTLDKVLVPLSSLVVVGSIAWVPLLFTWLWKKWKTSKNSSKRTLYASLLLTLLGFKIFGPHRYPNVGEWLRARHWRLWKSWLRFVAFEVVADSVTARENFSLEEQNILAISPHGLVPFGLGFAAIPGQAARAFGNFRPVAATATNLFPFVNTFLKWLKSVDASRSSVDLALKEGDRIGLAPGGIAEMFEGYPKPGTHPDEEYVIARHKGFVKMAMKHGIPIVPVYCFGASKMLRRLQLPQIFEKISKLLRISIVIVFGAFGLPIPFRQRLMYTIGDPIYPPYMREGAARPPVDPSILQDQIDEMHTKFCNSLTSMFERHKESYGWGHKTLKLV